MIGSKVDRENSIRCRGGARPSQHFGAGGGTPAVGLKPGSCHLEGCGGPRMGTGLQGTAGERSKILEYDVIWEITRVGVRDFPSASYKRVLRLPLLTLPSSQPNML